MFASATSWDTTDQANLQAIKNALTQGSSSVWGYVSSISSKLTYNNKSIANIATDIYNLINNTFYYNDGGNHSITWWIHDMDVLISQALGSNGYLPQINNGLSYTDGSGNVGYWLSDIWQQEGVYLPALDDLKKGLTNIYNQETSMNTAARRINGHQNFITSSAQWQRNIFNGSAIDSDYILWTNGTPLGNIFGVLRAISDSTANGYNKLVGGQGALYGTVFDDPTDYTSYSNTTYSSFSSAMIGFLEPINESVIRLSYVLASDERMAAQEAAAANEQAVVDNFIDSSGDASASPSDFGSISDLSSGYQQNFGSTASVTGIFDIFDSDNFGWFSSETYQQLDTTVAQRGSSFETPLLDQQLEDISRALGVDYAN